MFRGVTRVLLSNAPIFDSVYVLNLPRRTDRRQHVANQIKKSQLAKFVANGKEGIRFVDGVEGKDVDVEKLHRDGMLTLDGLTRYKLPLEEKLFGMDLTTGGIGCALGHRKIWDMIVKEKNKCALILEDDVEFSPSFRRTIDERWQAIPKDWGLVYFGGLDLLAKGKPPRPFLADGVRYAYSGHRELTAYVLHADSAARCLDLSVPMTWQVDTHICSRLQHDPKAQDDYIADPKSYVFQPSLAIQVTSLGTDVQKTPAENPALEDASRRMREFVGGGTSVR